MTLDDKKISVTGLAYLQSGIELVVTEKMDGGNITLSRDGIHARSETSRLGPYETRAITRFKEFQYDIPDGISISAESLWAKRSVSYQNLPDVFLVFGVWDGDMLLSWDETVD